MQSRQASELEDRQAHFPNLERRVAAYLSRSTQNIRVAKSRTWIGIGVVVVGRGRRRRGRTAQHEQRAHNRFVARQFDPPRRLLRQKSSAALLHRRHNRRRQFSLGVLGQGAKIGRSGVVAQLSELLIAPMSIGKLY
jgi:hypothetical protein